VLFADPLIRFAHRASVSSSRHSASPQPHHGDPQEVLLNDGVGHYPAMPPFMKMINNSRPRTAMQLEDLHDFNAHVGEDGAKRPAERPEVQQAAEGT
jgi:hypothetical protein